jgi:hypothetical protein
MDKLSGVGRIELIADKIGLRNRPPAASQEGLDRLQVPI